MAVCVRQPAPSPLSGGVVPELSATTTPSEGACGAGTGSGWAGADPPDWTQVDYHAVSERAIAKARQSRGPVAIEPGRYTVILEPQAVGDIGGALPRPLPAAFLVSAAARGDPLSAGHGFLAKPGHALARLFGQTIRLPDHSLCGKLLRHHARR